MISNPEMASARHTLYRVAAAVCVSSLVLWSAAPVVAQSPPKNLKKVGDHWTAWDPPTTLPEDAEIHIIEPGDTLWDLAERFLGNPYLWPQIWERNDYILDAHWIYPGDPLVLGIQVEPQENLEMTAAGQEGAGDEAAGGFRYGDAYGSLEQLGGGDDIYCSGYIGDLEESFSLRIAHSEYDYLAPNLPSFSTKEVGKWGIVDGIQYNLSVGDIVYLDGGRSSGLSAGDVFTAVRPGAVVRDPDDQSAFGRLWDYVGRIRVLSVQDETAIAEVSYGCDAINVGMALVPFVQEPVPSERRSPMRPVNYPASRESLEGAPRILYAEDGILSIGQDHVVYVELPAGETIPGDIFTVYRVDEAADFPIVIGEVAILSVHSQSAVGKVLESRYPIYMGDVLELK